MKKPTLLARDLWGLRDRDVARLGDVALVLSKHDRLPVLNAESYLSPRTRRRPDNFDWSYYAPLIMLFTRGHSWPWHGPFCLSALPDVYFDSDRDLPVLTLRVPPGYASFVQEQPWYVLRAFCCDRLTYPPAFLTWWTDLDPYDFTGMHWDAWKREIERVLGARKRFLDADAAAAKPVAERLDRETAAKLLAIWLANMLPQSGHDGHDCYEIISDKHAIARLDNYSKLVTIEVRPASKAGPHNEPLRSPFDATMHVSLRWLTALLIELLMRLKHPRLPLREPLVLKPEDAPRILAALDMACEIGEQFPRRNIVKLRPTGREAELVQDLFSATRGVDG